MLDASKPLFIAVAEQIEDGILDGTYPEDSAVPSTNELAGFLQINPATAGKGLNRLVDDGVLTKRRGIGMFVTSGAVETIRSRRRSRFADEFLAPLLTEAQHIGITSEELAEMIRREAAK